MTPIDPAHSVTGLWRAPGARAADVGDEFPEGALDAPDEISRREFLRLAAAGAALAGMAACSQPAEPILPYVSSPNVAPGVPSYYATAMTIDGHATGLLVESRTGRPVKIEGNPDHPASLGAAGIFEQGSLWQLYDPDRARSIRHNRVASSWPGFAQAFAPRAIQQVAGRTGGGLRVLLEPTSSPLVAIQLRRLLETFPDARVYFHSPVSSHSTYAGARLAFGRPLQSHLSLEAADVIVSIDADLFGSDPMRLAHARHFATRRRPEGSQSMSRLYVVESMLTVTGGIADHRIALRPGQVGDAIRLLAAAVLPRPAPEVNLPAGVRRVIAAAAADLLSHRGHGLVVAGAQQPPPVHALAHAVNEALGNAGATVAYSAPTIIDAGEPTHALATLADEIGGGEVQVLIILDANPAYTAPGDLDFSDALRRVPHVAYLAPYENETALYAQWFVPAAHYLETWHDTRAYDGTVSIVQPLIAPLFGGRTSSEVLAALLGDHASTPYALVRTSWQDHGAADTATWNEWLRHGIVPGTTAPHVPTNVDTSAIDRWLTPEHREPGLEVVFPAGGTTYDGRFANNAWLQELPDPISKLTWDNAAYVAPATAARLEVETGDMIELRRGDARVQAAAFVLPGVAEDTVALPLGYGRTGSERVAVGCGFNTAALRTSLTPHTAGPVTLRRLMTLGSDGATPLRYPLATTQRHWTMEGREIALTTTLQEYERHPDVAHQRKQLPTLYDPFPERGVQWAMAVDLSVCTGCSACVVACQAENNIPTVGKTGVLASREMHWLRIDRYFSGPVDRPAVHMQPMLCQHCEKAPCEYVCPVNATVHSPDGLNEMVYNRCVGTRFCSNNCPYKVRRFNWFDYNTDLPAVQQLAKNPEVTVRERGVMEKCTFCVQRIRAAEIAARVDDREFDGREVVTACQQACPTRAIVFGSLHDPQAEVVRLHHNPRAYAVLHELGARPRVRYLARVVNENASLEEHA